MNKKSIKLVIKIIIVIIILIGISKLYKNYRIKHAKKIVELKTKEIEVFDDIKVKDIIKKINGKLITNPKINTTKIGKQEIEFKYKTNDKIEVPYTIKIKVVDKTPPIIDYPGTYTVEVNSITKKQLQKHFFCGDNYDDTPKCTIEGEYSLKEEGEYKVFLKGEDSSHNTIKNPFTLRVRSKIKFSSSKNNDKEEINTTSFEDIIKKYKTKNTKIGIDVSHWQGNINYKQVKKSGVEFVYIRVGRGDGIGKDYVLDDRFEEYIKGFNQVKIPIGVYFYSNANNEEAAKKEAKWLLSKIKKYKVDLEIVFDWENWDDYQEYHLSFYHLTKTAEAFINTVEKKGYKGMLYSSKYYLENIWYPIDTNIWLAHYTEKTNYEKVFKVWQLCDNGKVKGIDDNQVDIDIRYK